VTLEHVEEGCETERYRSRNASMECKRLNLVAGTDGIEQDGGKTKEGQVGGSVAGLVDR
jgi:hypothetical protein